MARRPGIDEAVPIAAPEFEFQVRGPAISAQTRNKGRLKEWMSFVAKAAREAWPSGRAALAGDLDVAISEFSAFATRDRDNMAKPILDAMQGVVYKNDRQIKGLHVDWRDIDGAYVVRRMSPVVAMALSAGTEFVWIRVSAHVPRKDLIR